MTESNTESGPMSRELSAAAVRPLVLAIVAAQPSYGYAILQRVKALSEGHFDWKEGMLYPVLHRLERENLLEGYWERSGGRRRKYYRISDHGRRALERERAAWNRANSALTKAWNGLR